MFDPTIYENIKVVIEGAVYDLDLAGGILVTDRKDQVDLATMSRYYSLSFGETGMEEGVRAEIRLLARVQDLASEILEKEEQQPGCQLEIRFLQNVEEPMKECQVIESILESIWQGRPLIKQQLSFTYKQNQPNLLYLNEIVLDFERKIDEGQIDDIQSLIDHMLHTVQTLNRLKKS